MASSRNHVSKPSIKVGGGIHIVDVTKDLLSKGHKLPAGAKAYELGKVSALVNPMSPFGWSLSARHPTRFPTWEELKILRYALIPRDITIAMFFPDEKYFSGIIGYTLNFAQVNLHTKEQDRPSETGPEPSKEEPVEE